MIKKLISSYYNEIFNNIKPKRIVYFIALISDCIIEASLFIIFPILVKLMIDAAVKADINLLKYGLILVVTVSLVCMIVFIISELIFFSTMHKTTVNIRNRLFNKILHLPVSYIESNHSGDTITRLTNDVNTMQYSYGWPLRNTVLSLLLGISSVIVMLVLDWRISIVLIIVGFLSVLINTKQVENLRVINDQIQNNTSKYTENVSNVFSGFTTIKNFQLEKYFLEKSDSINREAYNFSIELAKKNAFMESRNFIFNWINFTGIITASAYLAVNGISDLGTVVSLIYLLGNINRMFNDMNGMLFKLQGFLAGSNRVNELLKTEEEPKHYNTPASSNKNAMIQFESVCFSYDGLKKVLDGFEIEIMKGQVVGLVGQSGAGKSTIIKILLGFYQPSSGNVTIFGRALKDYTLEELRKMIAYVPQDAYIFDGTIEENIKYGRPDASAEDIIQAAKVAHAHEFIMETDNGYSTLVGERGSKLSGGQRQRIAIARAILKDAPILLFDEATSSLDSESEGYVQDSLNQIKNKTVIIISHRLSTLKNTDTLFVIDSGRVIKSGKSNMLLNSDLLYDCRNT